VGFARARPSPEKQPLVVVRAVAIGIEFDRAIDIFLRAGLAFEGIHGHPAELLRDVGEAQLPLAEIFQLTLTGTRPGLVNDITVAVALVAAIGQGITGKMIDRFQPAERIFCVEFVAEFSELLHPDSLIKTIQDPRERPDFGVLGFLEYFSTSAYWNARAIATKSAAIRSFIRAPKN
jgi:hypothetical protein